jgi:hypothetical protein
MMYELTPCMDAIQGVEAAIVAENWPSEWRAVVIPMLG